MTSYGFRPNRPKTGDGYYRDLHSRSSFHSLDNVEVKRRGPARIRWLRGLSAHLQSAVARAAFDSAKGEKRTGKISLSNAATVTALENIGITTKWRPCPDIVRLLALDISFIKVDYVRTVKKLEFKQLKKIVHYFDANNESRQTMHRLIIFGFVY